MTFSKAVRKIRAGMVMKSSRWQYVFISDDNGLLRGWGLVNRDLLPKIPYSIWDFICDFLMIIILGDFRIK